MSELERVGRLPVFVDEDQWARAYQAAKDTVELLFSQGLIEVPGGPAELTTVATRIATAALRAAAEDVSGDIGDVPGVHIDEIGNHTATTTTTAAAASHRHRDRSGRKEED